MGPNGPVSMGSLPTSSCSLPRQQSQQTSISEGAGSRTGSVRARAQQQQQESRGAIPRNSSIGSAATTSSGHGSAGGAGGVGRPGNPRPSRPARLPAVPVIQENRVDAGTSTADGIQSRLEEAKTPTDSTGSSESWFATLFRSASLR